MKVNDNEIYLRSKLPGGYANRDKSLLDRIADLSQIMLNVSMTFYIFYLRKASHLNL